MNSTKEALKLLSRSHRLLGQLGAWGAVLVLLYTWVGPLLNGPEYSSTGKMIVSTKLAIPEASIYTEELSNFLGTQAALMQSGTVISRAHARLTSLKPELRWCPTGLRVTVLPKTTIFVLQASGPDRDYTQPFLQACMEEYVAVKREMRMQASDTVVASLTEEVMRLEKELRKAEEERAAFVSTNSLVALSEEIAAYQRQPAALAQKLMDLKVELDSLPSQGQSEEKRSALRTQIATLEGSLKESEARSLEITGKTLEYQRLKSNVQRIQALYDRLLATMQNLDVNKEISPENVTILEPASHAMQAHPFWVNRVRVHGLLVLAISCLLIYTGRCLERGRQSSFCLIVAALECLLFPVGTVLGIFTLLTLWRGVHENAPSSDYGKPRPAGSDLSG
jgi:hypothetical protein